MDRPESISIFNPLERSEDSGVRSNFIRITAWMIAVACAALIAVSSWLVVRAHDLEILRSQTALTNLAHAVTEQIEGAISEIAHVVDSLVFDLERADAKRITLQGLQPVLVNHVAGIDALKGLFVYDASGAWVVHSEAATFASQNNADREYFQFHRNNPSERVRVSLPIMSRSSGQWVIPISRRVNDADGNFNGVVLATLDVAFLREVLDRYEVGKQGTITLALNEQVLLRRPYRADEIGVPIPPTARQAIFESRKSGVVDGASPFDGVDRIISFDHMRNYPPIRVAVALSKDEVLLGWRTASYVQGMVTFLLCVLVAASGTYVIRAMRLRLDAEAGLRATRDALSIANERLSHLAQYDGLTGLPNRRYFDARFSRVFEQAQREKTLLSVVLVDVDEFKKYNDHYGHVQGDECLRRIARAVQSAARRPGDFVGRYGGEELVMLLPDTDAASAAVVAEDARLAVISLATPHEAAALGRVSISLGTATVAAHLVNERYELIDAADGALYQAKRLGRNRVCAAS